MTRVLNHRLQPMVSKFEGEREKKVSRSIFSVLESNNLLEDLHIPDSRLIDGDAAELALIGKS